MAVISVGSLDIIIYVSLNFELAFPYFSEYAWTRATLFVD